MDTWPDVDELRQLRNLTEGLNYQPKKLKFYFILVKEHRIRKEIILCIPPVHFTISKTHKVNEHQ